MDRYTMKRKLLTPLTAWRRRRASRLGAINHPVWESMGYSRGMRRFYLAARDQPDLLVDADLTEGSVVLDVGAFEGQWTARALARADDRSGGCVSLSVHAFEPEPGVLDRLRGSATGRDPRVTVHPFGLGGRDRTESLLIGGPGSSVFDRSEAPAPLGRVDVELRDVDAVLRAEGVDHIDLIKVNIEGGEFELIDRLYETGWLARTGTFIVQFHEFHPEAHRSRRRNRRQLAATHRRTWSYGWVFERWDPR